jgi:hypothetical protein
VLHFTVEWAVIIAFTLGHGLHALGHLVDQWPPKSCHGELYDTNVVVYDRDHQTFLSAMELDKLTEKIYEKFAIAMKGLNLQESKGLLTWCNVVIRIIGNVYYDAKRSALLETYIRDYVLYLGLAAAFIILVVCFLFTLIVPRARPEWLLQKHATGRTTLRWSLAGWILLLLIGGTYISLYRLFYFDGLYVGELYLEFIAD